jgi:hypothetical protein
LSRPTARNCASEKPICGESVGGFAEGAVRKIAAEQNLARRNVTHERRYGRAMASDSYIVRFSPTLGIVMRNRLAHRAQPITPSRKARLGRGAALGSKLC